jgi:hypothetical protein
MSRFRKLSSACDRLMGRGDMARKYKDFDRAQRLYLAALRMSKWAIQHLND